MAAPLVVLGAGGHAKVVIDTALSLGYDNLVVLDDASDRWGQQFFGFPVHGPLREVKSMRNCLAIMGIGSNRIRCHVAETLQGIEWATLVHPTAYVAREVELQSGVVVMAGAIVQPGTIIGKHSILNTACSVDHDCIVGAFCHVAPGARLAGQVALGDGVLVGVAAAMTPGRTIGEWSTVGGGSIVVRDVHPHQTVVGVPAKIKEVLP